MMSYYYCCDLQPNSLSVEALNSKISKSFNFILTFAVVIDYEHLS